MFNMRKLSLEPHPELNVLLTHVPLLKPPLSHPECHVPFVTYSASSDCFLVKQEEFPSGVRVYVCVCGPASM